MLIEMLPFPLNRIGLVTVELKVADGMVGMARILQEERSNGEKRRLIKTVFVSWKARIYPLRIFGGNYHNLPFFIN